jgi:putative ABC transport system permease protein
LSDADDENAPRVAVINATMAERYWPGREPVGARFQQGDTWLTVVGVVRNATLRDLTESPSPWFFLPVLQAYRPDTTLIVRSAADPASLARPLAETVADLDPTLALFGLRTLQLHIGASDFRQRAGSQILGLFGVIGLALAAIGLYGLLAFAVAERTREIGIRMALGGARGDILRLVLGRGLTLTLTGLALGVALAAALSRLLASLLIGVDPWDPVTFAGVAGLLAAVAVLACALPARRAAHVDPIVALRSE